MELAFIQAAELGGVDTAAIVAVIASFIPVLAQIANNNRDKAVVAIILSVVIAVLTAVVDGNFAVGSLILIAMEAFLVQLGAYKAFWKPIAGMNGGDKTASAG